MGKQKKQNNHRLLKHTKMKNRLTLGIWLNKEILSRQICFYKCDLSKNREYLKEENPKLKGEVLWNLEIKEKFSEKGMGIEPRSSPIIFEKISYI